MPIARSNPLGSLPEAIALPLQVERYVAVAQLTMYTYDWLLSVSEECEILSKAGWSRSNMVYFLSRIFEFGHQFILVILIFVPSTKSCDALLGAIGTCGAVSVSCTSLLFLLRIRAVYLKSRFIMILFGTIWLVSVALNILQAASMHGEIIPGTTLCTNIGTKYFMLPSISTFINDTLIFLAITFRLCSNALIDESWRSRFLSVVKGKGMYRLSRSLLLSGQIYYLTVIVFFIANFVVMLSPLIPTGDHFLTAMILGAFTNMMACRVFRGVALGMMEDHPTTGLSTTRIAAAMELDAFPSALRTKSDVAKHGIR
ncbi:hypothetical protein FIBSPDRAFT_1054285 [Athelia psychrophila]|uniref:DUF6533 domain-containing protein n=1 Tax=Athelia psychrophila TaxID=1759441 RepID=A0A167VKA8_9AGAM|nr:hypothetical protein FIBSPDRAFT_1054285 [Fibularhizoctonia sp. CBS 109695]